MTGRPPEWERTPVLVRLSDIAFELRYAVAERLIRRDALRGAEAADLLLAAHFPSHGTSLSVPAEKAQRVLVERKLPLGLFPRFG